MIGAVYFAVSRDALGTCCIKRMVCLNDDHARAEASRLGALRLEDENGRDVPLQAAGGAS